MPSAPQRRVGRGKTGQAGDHSPGSSFSLLLGPIPKGRMSITERGRREPENSGACGLLPWVQASGRCPRFVLVPKQQRNESMALGVGSPQ